MKSLVYVDSDLSFIVGASMLELYEERRWALVPEESIVRQYFKDPRMPFTREVFPNVKV